MEAYFFSLKLVTWTVFAVVFLVGMALLMSLERHTKKALLSIVAFVTPGPGHTPRFSWLSSPLVSFSPPILLSLVLSAAGVFPSWNVGAGCGRQ